MFKTLSVFVISFSCSTLLVNGTPLTSLSRRIPPGISTWDYLGCFTESYITRALSSNSFDSSTLTVDKCAAFCDAENYSLFGVEYGTECYCGNKLNMGSIATDEQYCDFVCPGDNRQSCGSGNRLNLYKKRDSAAVITSTPTAPTPVPTPFTALGCYTDSTSNRALKGAKYTSDLMTVEKCAASCKGWTLFGVEYAFECFCGTRLEASNEVTIDQCNMPCRGNQAQQCGAGNRLNVYRLETTSSSSSLAASPTTTAAATTTTAVPNSESTNLVANGDFEQGLAPWTLTEIGGKGSLITTTTHTGTSAFHVLQYLPGASADINIGGFRQMVSIIPGRSYRFRMWTNRISGQCTIDVFLANLRISSFWYAYQDSGWRETIGPATLMPATLPSSVDFFVRIQCMGRGDQEMVVDDVQLLLV